MLRSNSFSPGLGALEHAIDALAELFADISWLLFVPYTSSEPDTYTERMRQALALLAVRVIGAHRTPDLLAALAASGAVFVGRGNFSAC